MHFDCHVHEDIKEVRVYHKGLIGIVSKTTPPCLTATEDFSSPQNIGGIKICTHKCWFGATMNLEMSHHTWSSLYAHVNFSSYLKIPCARQISRQHSSLVKIIIVCVIGNVPNRHKYLCVLHLGGCHILLISFLLPLLHSGKPRKNHCFDFITWQWSFIR